MDGETKTPETVSDALPRIAKYKPFYAELKAGRTYLWCACGLSKKQPYCDNSHVGTGIEPVRYKAEESEEVLFCGCKRTGDQPFCDGSHNNLLDEYDEDDPNSPENLAIPEIDADPDGKARLNGGCFVAHTDDLTYSELGALRIARVIGGQDGANWQSHFRILAPAGEGPVLSFGDRHTILLATEGSGAIEIGGRRFDLAPEVGIYVRPGEDFRLIGDSPVAINAAVSPLADWPESRQASNGAFDERWPDRCVPIDPENRNAMADRFFQVLVDKSVGSDMATQFIGEVPLSKAAPHRHLYEESLIVLRGEGMMWTEDKRTAVRTGDVIFLPRKQIHSLQCTDPGGMMLAGVIYPGDNPSINY